MKVKSLSRIRLFVTSWTAAYQAPLSIGFSRQEYWSGVASPSPGEQYGVSLKKLKIELPCDPAIPLLGIYPEKIQIRTPVLIALFTIAR